MPYFLIVSNEDLHLKYGILLAWKYISMMLKSYALKAFLQLFLLMCCIV